MKKYKICFIVLVRNIVLDCNQSKITYYVA